MNYVMIFRDFKNKNHNSSDWSDLLYVCSAVKFAALISFIMFCHIQTNVLLNYVPT
jgi:hypothetical protein